MDQYAGIDRVLMGGSTDRYQGHGIVPGASQHEGTNHPTGFRSKGFLDLQTLDDGKTQ